MSNAHNTKKVEKAYWELHAHLGGSVPAPILWEIICEENIPTKFKSFDELQTEMSPDPDSIQSLDDFLGRFFSVTELIQSSPRAVETSCYQMIAKAYRRTKGLAGEEVRFNPLKRTKDVHDIDLIMDAATRGLSRASAHYGVETGIIVEMGRDLTIDQNREIVNTAIRWRAAGANQMFGYKGVIGVDMAGPESGKLEQETEWIKAIAELFEFAHNAGLKSTYHIGETKDSGYHAVHTVIERINPNRLGHGLRGMLYQETIDLIKTRDICLEICPSVNLLTKAISRKELAMILKELLSREMPFVICTDNPYLAHTNLPKEYELASELVETHTPEELHKICNLWAIIYSFL